MQCNVNVCLSIFDRNKYNFLLLNARATVTYLGNFHDLYNGEMSNGSVMMPPLPSFFYATELMKIYICTYR